ncbi:MAG: hypothetical protein L6R42_005430 [Xanthoria sp. 1 TBL-2021]|nr:MAG: hypothetical protein L6R42_005430 [Xanthoria sp. 1 TBL-2021]
MSENTESQSPKLEAILSKLPKEVLPIWTTYSQSRPNQQTETTWKNHNLLLAYLTNNRAGHVSALPTLEISRFLAILDSLEGRLAVRRVQVKVLEAERALGDDASRRLEIEIRTAREDVWEYESWVETYSESVLKKREVLSEDIAVEINNSFESELFRQHIFEGVSTATGVVIFI